MCDHVDAGSNDMERFSEKPHSVAAHQGSECYLEDLGSRQGKHKKSYIASIDCLSKGDRGSVRGAGSYSPRLWVLNLGDESLAAWLVSVTDSQFGTP